MKKKLKSLNILLAILILFNAVFLQQVQATKHFTGVICLNPNSELTLKCDQITHGLFLTQVEYSNDHLNTHCKGDPNQQLNQNDTTSSKNLIENKFKSKCIAYETTLNAELCNGKNECTIKSSGKEFKYGFDGANCDFVARTLHITYECIPVSFDDPNVPKYDVCDKTGKISHPIHGFIHSPNYPSPYYPREFCQLSIKLDQAISRRLEIFLIELVLEGLSRRTASPTDYLQINNNEKYIAKRQNMLVYNDTKEAVVTFKTDNWFNEKGFFLYFQVVEKVEEIVLEEKFEYDFIDQTNTTKLSSDISVNSTNNTKNVNQSVLTNAKERMNINDLLVSSSKFSSDSTIIESKGISTSFISDHTLQAILTLMVLIVILSSIIIFLALNNRKRFFNELYKTSMRMNELNNQNNSISAYMDANNPSVVYLNPDQNRASYYGQNKLQRISDDSTAQLLLNQSINNQSDLIALASSSSTVDVNTKLNQLNRNSKLFMNPNQVYEDINEKMTKSMGSSAKLNEYSYIPSSLMSKLASNDHLDTMNELKIDLTNRPTTSANIICSSSSTSSSNAVSPLASNMDVQLTSTPCVPKTLPPSMNDRFSKQSQNGYDMSSQMLASNEYTVCFNQNLDGSDDDCDQEYKIPTNLPK